MEAELKRLSQRTLVRMMEVFKNQFWPNDRVFNFLYEHDFADWFLRHAQTNYDFEWQQILVDLRNTHFFYPGDFADSRHNITGSYLSERDAAVLGEAITQKLAGVVATLNNAEGLRNSLQLDGYGVDPATAELISLEG